MLENIIWHIKKRKRLYFFLHKIYIPFREFLTKNDHLFYFVLILKSLSIKNFKFASYKLITFKAFCQLRKTRYFVIEEEQPRKALIPHYYGSQEDEIIQEYISPEIYLAEVFDANIVGANGFVLANKHCLLDMALSKKKARYDLRYQSLKRIEKNEVLIEYNFSGIEYSEGILLCGFAPHNYFHITLELLSRLQYIDNFEEFRSLPILIDEIVFEIPQFSDLFNIINKHNHLVIPIKCNSMYKIHKLIFPSYNTWMPINLKEGIEFEPEDTIIAISAVKHIRESVFENLKISNAEGFRKIFISRKNQDNSRLTNEWDVISLFRSKGFEIVFPEELSFIEQVELFGQAKYIVGATGAAFTNIIYCPDNAEIICIIPKEYKFYLYSTLCHLLKLKCIFLDAKIVSKEKYISVEKFKMDLDYCENFILQLED
ncbi:MAG: glycosyltransferase family 61 protein [Eubacteriales bacterium]